MIFLSKLLLAVFMLIDMLLAWQYANDRNICSDNRCDWCVSMVQFLQKLCVNRG